ncbi:MAG TPA: type II toxin-antitoxin system VapC family toxin [Thermodesulfovibrionales bacterium]|nr:type II toxin-antitoxin system VapC family toxin [Thermodesulfovibrionales bacterium]
MIVYLDASAIVKRYVSEAGSTEVNALIAGASVVGTAAISRAEVSSALAKAVRMRLLSREEAASALQVFNSEWESLIRLQLTEVLISHAATLAWEHGLRGYDAVHLAAAIFWQDMLGDPVTLSSYDRQLWEAAKTTGLVAWPE